MCKKCRIIYPDKKCKCKCFEVLIGGKEYCEICEHWINNAVVKRNKIAIWFGALFIFLDAVLVYYIGITNLSIVSQSVYILIADLILFAALECFWVGRKKVVE